MKIKRVFSSVMALALTTTLAACGNSNDTNKDDNASNKTKEETSTTDEKSSTDINKDEDKGSSDTDKNEGDEEAIKDFENVTDDDTLVIGVDNLGGDFIQGYTNNTNDVKARRFMGIEGNNGFTTHYVDEAGQWHWNPATLEKEPKIVNNEDGSATVEYKLKKDLKWSDGEPITADDYLFGTLLESDSNFNTLTGSINIGADSLVGYNEFKKGTTDEFDGIEKLDDYSFKITIKADELPYFELPQLTVVGPSPMHYIAPNLSLADNGKSLKVKDGYKVTDEDKKDFAESVDNKIEKIKEELDESYPEEPKEGSDERKEYDEALKEKDDQVKDLEDSKQGDIDPTRLLIDKASLFETEDYRLNPAVVCGPYKFDEYKNNMVKLSLNENYTGNFNGDKATIPHIIIQVINPNIAVDLLENGDIDIWEDEMKGGRIDQMKAAEQAGKIGLGQFERNGFGNITFLTDRGSTKYKEVRQAIAYLLDRNEFVTNYAGGYGVVTNGYYGLSQWMYKERGADLETKLTNYTLNTDKANELLDKTPYKYEKDGKTPWSIDKANEQFKGDVEGFDYYRYDENGNKLVVNQFGGDDSEITTLISNQLPVNAAQVGMEYNVQSGSLQTLLDYYNFPKDDPDYTAFNMGTGFAHPFDPWLHFSSEGPFNKTKVNDKKADEVTEALRRTDPDDKDGYLDKWEEFNEWYNDYLPEIPLYANQYHTGYTNRVKGFDIMTPEWHANDQINAMTLEK
jgi:extracellular solute-binding protein family 5